MTSTMGRLLAAIALTVGATMPAWAQAPYPNRPVTLVVAYPPGGTADVVGRLMARKLSERLGQTVVVENKPGASGNIGTSQVARARPDGYTLLMNNNTLAMTTALGMQDSVDLERDLHYLAAVASTPVVIAVHPSVPATNLEELVAYAERQAGSLNYSSCGNGSPQHFAGEQFVQLAKVQMTNVPYLGCAPPVIDGIGGQVSVLFNSMPNLDAHVSAGKLRYIAVAAENRLPFKPDLPAVAEAPGFAGFDAEVVFGIMAPADLPADVARRLEQELLAIAADDVVSKELADHRISTYVLDGEQYRQRVLRELGFYARLARDVGIRLD